MRLWTVGLIILLAGSPQTRRTDGNEILRLCEQNLSDVKDYTVNLTADLNMERVRIPRMNAVMYFKAPDKVHFESPNFALLPREGFGLPVSTLIERYEATFRGKETLEGVEVYKLQLVAKNTATRLQQLYVWVNPANHTVVRTETVPYQGRSASIRFTYGLQDGKYWLPESLEVKLSVAAADTSDREPEAQMPAAQQLQDFRRRMGSGMVSIVYSNYRINTGLSDEIFERREKE